MRINPANVKAGLAIVIAATVSDASYNPILPQGGSVSFTDTVLGKSTAVTSVSGEHTVSARHGEVHASFDSSTGESFLIISK